METLIYIFVIIILILIISGGVIWYLFVYKKKIDTPKNKEDDNDKSFLMLQNQIENLARSVDIKLGESQTQMQTAVKTQFGESQKLIKDITEQITHVKETNRQVVNVTDQLKTLQNILQNPKQRGVLGEYYLDTVLKNVLPPENFKLQYKFPDGDIVDAVIFFNKTKDDKILPVDSKFSLENYNRIVNEKDENEIVRLEKLFVQDIKNRIDETSKYIRPKDGTMDFAFMFIPSEAIYYDLLVNKVGSVKSSTRDLIEYAFREKHVIIVSPTSFMAYLQTVMQGLRALKIEDSAKEIQKRVGELGRHISNYDQFMAKLGNSLGTTVNHYNTAHKELKKIDKDVVRISGTSPEVDPLIIEKPKTDDES
jgi:DNA recombination protein RmuC